MSWILKFALWEKQENVIYAIQINTFELVSKSIF